jgi:hypothetical protein
MFSIREGMLKVEKQMHVSGQIDEEWGNVEADRACGRIRKMALSKDELEWLDKVDGGGLSTGSWRRSMILFLIDYQDSRSD